MEAGLTLAGEDWWFGGEQSVVGDEEPDDRDVEFVQAIPELRGPRLLGTRTDVYRRGMGVGYKRPGLVVVVPV